MSIDQIIADATVDATKSMTEQLIAECRKVLPGTHDWHDGRSSSLSPVSVYAFIPGARLRVSWNEGFVVTLGSPGMGLEEGHAHPTVREAIDAEIASLERLVERQPPPGNVEYIRGVLAGLLQARRAIVINVPPVPTTLSELAANWNQKRAAHRAAELLAREAAFRLVCREIGWRAPTLLNLFGAAGGPAVDAHSSISAAGDTTYVVVGLWSPPVPDVDLTSPRYFDRRLHLIVEGAIAPDRQSWLVRLAWTERRGRRRVESSLNTDVGSRPSGTIADAMSTLSDILAGRSDTPQFDAVRTALTAGGAA